jgi:hypothetical protein
VQLTGKAAYQRAGTELGINLVKHPELATNPFVSAAVASWYWSVEHGINLAADHLDMAAVNTVMAAPATPLDGYARCASFVTALRWFNGGVQPDGVNCDRKVKSPWAAFAMLPPAFLQAWATPAPAPAPTLGPSAASPGSSPPSGSPSERSLTGTPGTPTTSESTPSTTEAPTTAPSTTTPAPTTTTTAPPPTTAEPAAATTTAPAD